MHSDEETTQVCNYLLFDASRKGSAQLAAPECEEPPSEDPARMLVLVNRHEHRTVTVDMGDELDRHRLIQMVHAGVMS
jgi:hypothetical protein